MQNMSTNNYYIWVLVRFRVDFKFEGRGGGHISRFEWLVGVMGVPTQNKNNIPNEIENGCLMLICCCCSSNHFKLIAIIIKSAIRMRLQKIIY